MPLAAGSEHEDQESAPPPTALPPLLLPPPVLHVALQVRTVSAGLRLLAYLLLFPLPVVLQLLLTDLQLARGEHSGSPGINDGTYLAVACLAVHALWRSLWRISLSHMLLAQPLFLRGCAC
jgi:hypothetical protein